MRKTLFGAILLASAIAVPVSTMAEVGISIGISLPPPVVFSAPPEVVVIPDAPDVYVVPDLDVDIFFWGGWWWRPWEGRWYRSRYYDRGWAYYREVPSFFFSVDPGWRGYYRGHDWHGHRWNYERIPYGQLRRNWRGWRDNRRWERRETWGVQGYRPVPRAQMRELRRERQEEYRRRPEVQRHEQERLQQQRRPEGRSPQGREQGRSRVQEPRGMEQGRPRVQERGGVERGRPHVQEPPRQQQRPQVERPQQRPQQQERVQPHGPQREGESRREQPQGGRERRDAGPR